MNAKQVHQTKQLLSALLTVAHHGVDLVAVAQEPEKLEPKPEKPKPLTFGFYLETLVKSLSKVLIVTAVEAVIVALFLMVGAGAAAILFGIAAVAGLWTVERLARKQLTTAK